MSTKPKVKAIAAWYGSNRSCAAEVVYREAAGFPGYRVGDDGSVWTLWEIRRYRGSAMGTAWRPMTPGTDKDGYLKLTLHARPRRRTVRINVLVLETFVGPMPNPGMVAAHWNGVRTDNLLTNLRWATQQENIADKRRHGTHQAGERHAAHKLTASQVAEIRERRARGERGVDLAREFGVKDVTISAIHTGRNWKGGVA